MSDLSDDLASAGLVSRLRREFTFQISVDTDNLQQGLVVAAAALAGGTTILEMGTPLLKLEGVLNVVPAFRRHFPSALLLADMKTMDGGAGEARAVFAAGGHRTAHRCVHRGRREEWQRWPRIGLVLPYIRPTRITVLAASLFNSSLG